MYATRKIDWLEKTHFPRVMEGKNSIDGDDSFERIYSSKDDDIDDDDRISDDELLTEEEIENLENYDEEEDDDYIEDNVRYKVIH